MTNKIFTRQSFLKFWNWLLEGIATLCTPGRYHSWKDLWIINTIYRYLFKIKNKLDTFINLRESINHSSTNQRWKFIWYIDFLSLVLIRHPFCRTSISKGSSITEATMPIFPPLRVIVSFGRDRKPFTWVTERRAVLSLPLLLSFSRWVENNFSTWGHGAHTVLFYVRLTVRK